MGRGRRDRGGRYARAAGTATPAAKKPPSPGQSIYAPGIVLPVKDSSTSSSDAIAFAGDLLAAAVHVGYHHRMRTPRRTEQRMQCGRVLGTTQHAHRRYVGLLWFICCCCCRCRNATRQPLAATIDGGDAKNGKTLNRRNEKKLIMIIIIDDISVISRCRRFALFGYCLWSTHTGGKNAIGVCALALWKPRSWKTAPRFRVVDDFGTTASKT